MNNPTEIDGQGWLFAGRVWSCLWFTSPLLLPTFALQVVQWDGGDAPVPPLPPPLGNGHIYQLNSNQICQGGFRSCRGKATLPRLGPPQILWGNEANVFLIEMALITCMFLLVTILIDGFMFRNSAAQMCMLLAWGHHRCPHTVHTRVTGADPGFLKTGESIIGLQAKKGGRKGSNCGPEGSKLKKLTTWAKRGSAPPPRIRPWVRSLPAVHKWSTLSLHFPIIILLSQA